MGHTEMEGRSVFGTIPPTNGSKQKFTNSQTISTLQLHVREFEDLVELQDLSLHTTYSYFA